MSQGSTVASVGNLNVIGTPPFEQPTISQIILNYVTVKYSGKEYDSTRPALLKVETIVKNQIDHFGIKPETVTDAPDDVIPMDSKRNFSLNYARWKYYCAKSTSPTGAAPKYKTTEVFGKTMWRALMPKLKEDRNNGFLKNLPPVVRNLLVPFFEDLEKEVSNDASPILSSNPSLVSSENLSFTQTTSTSQPRPVVSRQSSTNSVNNSPITTRTSREENAYINRPDSSNTPPATINPALLNNSTVTGKRKREDGSLQSPLGNSQSPLETSQTDVTTSVHRLNNISTGRAALLTARDGTTPLSQINQGSNINNTNKPTGTVTSAPPPMLPYATSSPSLPLLLENSNNSISNNYNGHANLIKSSNSFSPAVKQEDIKIEGADKDVKMEFDEETEGSMIEEAKGWVDPKPMLVALSTVFPKFPYGASSIIHPEVLYLSTTEDSRTTTDANNNTTVTNITLSFIVVKNDGNPQNFRLLTDLKNIFGMQLPKMPKEYITRLVFDPRHRGLMLIKNNSVIGGIAFRPFYDKGFLEIVFCAITGQEQIKGYGTYIMSHLKEFARREKLCVFLTYADNYAMGYFRKQGFTKEVSLQRESWGGYIKDYEGATIMECVIHPEVNYLRVVQMIDKQRDIVNEKMNEIAKQSMVVHKGISRERAEILSSSGRKSSTNGTAAKRRKPVPGSQPIRKRIAIEKIPGISESMYRLIAAREEHRKMDMDTLTTLLRDALKKLKEHPSAWPFLAPVDKNDVADYYDIIKDPIDLRTIEDRLESEQYYVTKEIFIADVKRICMNCKIYNSPDTCYYGCADEIEKHLEDIFR